MTAQEQPDTSVLTASRIWWVVAFSVGITMLVVLISSYQGATWETLRAVQVDWHWIAAACGLVVLRDVGYILRLLVLSRGQLNAPRATTSIVMWELASALTPSVVGGSAVAAFILNRNGMRWGRSLATVMSTALLDEVFFLLAVPLTAAWIGWGWFLPEGASWIQGSVALVFAGGYAFMLCLATFMSTALFWAPSLIQRSLAWLFNRSWLHRWKAGGHTLARELKEASMDLKTMSFASWGMAIGTTAVSWMARFLTLNALLMAFLAPLMASGQTVNHVATWARQLSMWTVLMISPTPGSSGLAEAALPTFLADALPAALGVATWAAVVLTWRWLTYHLYLVVGGTLMPFWVAHTSVQTRLRSRNFEPHE